MITYRFTAKEDGMFVSTYTDVGYIKHLDCAGDMTTEFTVPYADDAAKVYFGAPYNLEIVSNNTDYDVKLSYHYGNTAVLWKEGSTFVLQLEKQPSMKYAVANIKRN